MSAEKYIKNEAKTSLKGNWIKIITALFTATLVILAVAIVAASSFDVMGDYDDFGAAAAENPVKLVFFVLFHLIAVAGLLLLSPVFAGYAKITASIAADKESDIGDMFFYFSNGDIYKDCVKFMTRVIVSFVAMLILFELPCLGGYILFQDKKYVEILVVLLGVLGFFGAYLFSLKNQFAVMLYAQGLGRRESFDKGTAVAKGNSGKLVKLTFSFFWWIVSFFVVVPFIYVVPYLSCSHFISAKYLIEQYDKAHEVQPELGIEKPSGISEGTSAPVMFTNPNYTSAQNAEPLTFKNESNGNSNKKKKGIIRMI